MSGQKTLFSKFKGFRGSLPGSLSHPDPYRKILALLLPLIFISLFFYIPLLRVLFKGADPATFFSLFQSGYYRKILFFTVYQASLSTILSLITALPGAWLLSRYDFPGKKLIKAAASLPFVLPSILTVLGFVILFGNNGLINRFFMDLTGAEEPPFRILYSVKAVLLAHVFYNFPLAMRIISSLWSSLPWTQNEASLSLGASRFKTFIHITLPALRPALATSGALIFLYCFMSFAIILVLGGGPSLTTIEVEVYRFARGAQNLSKAGSLALIESFITLTVLALYLKSEGRLKSVITGQGYYQKLSKIKALISLPYFLTVFLIIIAPILTIIGQSFLRRRGFAGQESFSLHWYSSLLGFTESRFSEIAAEALQNSLFLALSAVIITLPLALFLAWILKNSRFPGKNIYKGLFVLPMGISSIIIGLSYLSPPEYLDFLSGSRASIILAHTIIALPLALRSVSTIYDNIDSSLSEASNLLGASRLKTLFFIEIPLIKAGLITAAVFTFALSAGEMNATIMLSSGEITTLPLAIYRLIGSYNYFGACALGTLLLLVCFITFSLIDYMEGEKCS